MITYDVDGVKMPKIKKRLINKWIKAVAATYGRKTGDIGYMFVDDEKILEEIFSKTDLPISLHCEDENTIKENTQIYIEKYASQNSA